MDTSTDPNRYANHPCVKVLDAFLARYGRELKDKCVDCGEGTDPDACNHRWTGEVICDRCYQERAADALESRVGEEA